MNSYELLKNAFMVEIEEALPMLNGEQISLIGSALDRAAYRFDVQEKQVELSTYVYTIPSLVKTYIVIKKTEGRSDGTLKNYARVLQAFFCWCRKQPEEVTANDIRIFLYEYQNSHRITERTLDKYREMICWFFHWAFNEEYIPRNPARSVKAIKHEVKERQALTQIELEYMRIACNTLREKAILEFLYSTGCRVSELIALKKSDVDWHSGSVHLFGKGKKHRTSFINAKAEVSLREYLKSRTDASEYLFVSDRKPHGKLTKDAIEKIIREMAKRSNVGKTVTPHILRHTCATQAVNAGMPIEIVSEMLGHSSVNTTTIYAKTSHAKVQSEHLRCVI